MAAQLRHVPPPIPVPHAAGSRRFFAGTLTPDSISLRSSRLPFTASLYLLRPNSSQTLGSTNPIATGGDGGGDFRPPGDGGGDGGGWGSGDHNSDDPPRPSDPLGLFLEGWRSRVSADPDFPFKVLMEELVGVSACVLGDMASRPNFGLGELDLVFCTLVVGAIVNFVLMYLLAPTSSTSAAVAAASALPSHMFEPGNYSLSHRLSTFVFKGVTFAAVGFAAGLTGTAISNSLIALRKKMDPNFETQNKPPPTVLNALTWAGHMGLSSNLRYQTLNGIEFAMAQALPPPAFKASVVVLRCLNNVVGGMTFVALARLTGSQKAKDEKGKTAEETTVAAIRA